MKVRKFIPLLTALLLLGEFTAIAVYAQPKPSLTKSETEQNPVVDLAQVTCQSVLKMSDQDRAYTLIFFHGYMSGKNGEKLVDTAQLTAITGKIADSCTARPETPLMEVFTRLRANAQK
jgi:hypothetical protein